MLPRYSSLTQLLFFLSTTLWLFFSNFSPKTLNFILIIFLLFVNYTVNVLAIRLLIYNSHVKTLSLYVLEIRNEVVVASILQQLLCTNIFSYGIFFCGQELSWPLLELHGKRQGVLHFSHCTNCRFQLEALTVTQLCCQLKARSSGKELNHSNWDICHIFRFIILVFLQLSSFKYFYKIPLERDTECNHCK